MLPITTFTATLVAFSGQYVKSTPTISGVIDRVTGATQIDWMYENVGNNMSWDLNPATRFFLKRRRAYPYNGV
jgi:hypothetical protein